MNVHVWVSPLGCFLAEIPGDPRADVDEIIKKQTPIFADLSGVFNRASEWWETPAPKVGSEVRITHRTSAWAFHDEVGQVRETRENEYGHLECLVFVSSGWGAWYEDEDLRVLVP